MLQASAAETSNWGKGEVVGYISSLKALAAVIMPIMHARLLPHFRGGRRVSRAHGAGNYKKNSLGHNCIYICFCYMVAGRPQWRAKYSHGVP